MYQLTAKNFGLKMAYTVPPAAGPPQITPPVTPTAPQIGMRKALPKPPPAAASAISASRAMRPSLKTAAVAPEVMSPKQPKMAPSYTSQARKGKKVMPMPHNKQTKKASAPVEFGRQMGEACFQKRAILGTTVGGAYGAYSAPTGHKTEGLGRGVGQGLGWDLGAGLGERAGLGLGGLAAPALQALMHQTLNIPAESKVDPESFKALTQIAGGLTGYFGGGLAGRGAAKSMLGAPSWEKETKGDRQVDDAQMTAP